MSTFRLRINNGPEREFTTNTGMYMYAALAAVLEADDLLPLPARSDAILVEIWAPDLVQEYGPYRYLIWQDPNYFGRINIAVAIPQATPSSERRESAGEER